MYKILIVEDDFTIAKTLATHLKKWEYQVKYVEEFKTIMEQIDAYGPDLILLDITLPFFNGFYWCAEVRKKSKVPIMFVSSASDNMNIVMAMNMGGDEFVEKPFDLNVLTAKVQALLRRTYAFQEQINIIQHKGLQLNIGDATIVYKSKKVELTKNEYKILQLLMEHIGQIVSREEIMTRLWESDSFIDDNTLTVNVTRLRKTLEDVGIKDYIATKKGIGYLIQ